MGSQTRSEMQARLLSPFLLFLCAAVTVGDLSDSYTAPPAPRQSYKPSYKPSYSPPSYQAPSQVQTVQVELPNHDYHAGPPRVFHVKVPVTQKPYTVHVPQNVPVNFVPVSVSTQQLPGIQVVQQDPFTYFDSGSPYVQRKELVKGALLLGTGMVKGALLTHLYNQLN